MRSCFNEKEKPKKTRGPKTTSPGGPQAQKCDTNRSVSLRKLSSSLSAFLNALTDYDDYFESKTYSDIRSFQVEVLVCFQSGMCLIFSTNKKLRLYLKHLHTLVN